jgi:large subunit ribosomal protein L35
MPKLKRHKGLAKRMKVTGGGKLKHRRPGASHLMSVKSAKRRRHIRRTAIVHRGKAKAMKAALLGG